MSVVALGFDLGANWAWCRLTRAVLGAPPLCTMTRVARPNTGWSDGAVFARFATELREIINASLMVGPIHMACYENVTFTRSQGDRRPGGASLKFITGQKGILLATCEEMGIPYAGVAPMTLKKFATGDGRAKKALMRRRLIQGWGDREGFWAAPPKLRRDISEDEADAAWAAQYAMALIIGAVQADDDE